MTEVPIIKKEVPIITVSSVHNKQQLLPLGNHVFLSPRFHRGHSVVINMEEFHLISPTQFYIVCFFGNTFQISRAFSFCKIRCLVFF